MKVTAIRVQSKCKDRFSIDIDGEYRFSLSDYQLIEYGVYVGNEYSADEIGKLIENSRFGKAYERALNYCMIRPRSHKEIKDYLSRVFLYSAPKAYIDKSGQKQFKEQKVDKVKTLAMIEQVIQRLNSKGYIDDERFARAWVNSRLLSQKTSKRKLVLELRTKGVSDDIIELALQESGYDDKNLLNSLIDKKRRQSKYQDNTKLIQYLLGQGFDYEVIKNALNELVD